MKHFGRSLIMLSTFGNTGKSWRLRMLALLLCLGWSVLHGTVLVRLLVEGLHSLGTTSKCCNKTTHLRSWTDKAWDFCFSRSSCLQLTIAYILNLLSFIKIEKLGQEKLVSVSHFSLHFCLCHAAALQALFLLLRITCLWKKKLEGKHFSWRWVIF